MDEETGQLNEPVHPEMLMRKYPYIVEEDCIGSSPSGAGTRVQHFLIHLVSWWIFSFGLMNVAVAQEEMPAAHTYLNRNQVLLGEEVKMSLEVKTAVGLPVSKWPELPDSIHQLEILSKSSIDTTIDGDKVTYRQIYTITGFNPGTWIIPPLAVVVNNKRLHSDSLSLTIVPVPLTDSSYHDVRELIEVSDTGMPWWYWVAGIMTILALMVLIGLRIKSRANKRVPVKPASTASPFQEAMKALEYLEKARLANNEEKKEYYSQLTRIFKEFMEKTYKKKMMQKTTPEILVEIKSLLDKDLFHEVSEILREADTVKFARYQPNQDRLPASLNVIRKSVQSMNRQKK